MMLTLNGPAIVSGENWATCNSISNLKIVSYTQRKWQQLTMRIFTFRILGI